MPLSLHHVECMTAREPAHLLEPFNRYQRGEGFAFALDNEFIVTQRHSIQQVTDPLPHIDRRNPVSHASPATSCTRSTNCTSGQNGSTACKRTCRTTRTGSFRQSLCRRLRTHCMTNEHFNPFKTNRALNRKPSPQLLDQRNQLAQQPISNLIRFAFAIRAFACETLNCLPDCACRWLMYAPRLPQAATWLPPAR